nr:MAG: hypothetical protein [Caudoviricetes sp.]
MPVYDVRDKNTGEVTEMFMSIAKWEQFKRDNPDKEQYFTNMHFSDSISLGIKKPPRDFTEGVINRIKKNNPGNRMESRWD